MGSKQHYLQRVGAVQPNNVCVLAAGSTIYNESVVGKAMHAIGRGNVQIATKYFPAVRSERSELN